LNGVMRRLALLAFIWGWSFLFIKVAVKGMTPFTVAWGRITLGALVLAVFLWRKGLRLPTDRVMLRHFAVMATVGSVVPFTLLAWGEQRISSALTAVLNASTPLFTALFAFLAGQERLRRMQVLGLAVGVGGVAVVAGLGGSDLKSSAIAGSVAAIGAGACYGVAITYTRRFLVDTPPLVAAAGQLVGGSLLLAPLAIGTSVSHGLSLTATRVLSICLLGTVGTGLAFLLHYRNIATLGPTKASLVTYLVPVVAVAVGVIVLGETFEWRLPAGGALIVGGIALVTLRRAPVPVPELVEAPVGAPAAVMPE
jgi:drug/metabolite transporter (DMT)-like permease